MMLHILADNLALVDDSLVLGQVGDLVAESRGDFCKVCLVLASWSVAFADFGGWHDLLVVDFSLVLAVKDWLNMVLHVVDIPIHFALLCDFLGVVLSDLLVRDMSQMFVVVGLFDLALIQ